MIGDCSIEEFCRIMGTKWGCLIIKELGKNGEMGFNELLRMLKANPKTLSDKLKLLERNGLVERRVIGDRPIRVLYSLTKKGKEANKVDEEVSKWFVKFQ